ncbi:hypothetical protein [Hymenobacter edaphi]|uniref:Uncharacterized protein n=1 Tax=Hymenobacter edaphi TaxID=2211146 RepID=A0A328BY68_9BACT|nr:hypothetical protein [Hymenobacter edaphi]RAK70068.1 hypothetical protein DLM85_04235 [Hymenobacter edaphi]
MRLLHSWSFGPALGFAACLLGLTLLAAHFFAPLGWLISPVVLYQSVNPLNAAAARRGWRGGFALATLGLVCLQHMGLVLVAGGTLDAAGRGWMLLVTLASGLGVFTQLIDLVTPAPRPWPGKAAILLLFPLGLALYLSYSQRLGF